MERALLHRPSNGPFGEPFILISWRLTNRWLGKEEVKEEVLYVLFGVLSFPSLFDTEEEGNQSQLGLEVEDGGGLRRERREDVPVRVGTLAGGELGHGGACFL